MDMETEYLNKILRVVAEKLNIDKWHFEERNLNDNIVNYIGNFIRVSLIDETNKKEVALIIKHAPNVLFLEKLLDLLFTKEVHVYSTLMPIFRSLTLDVNLEELFPECYYADSKRTNRILVLKDMTSHEYERHSHGNYLDYKHTMISIEAVCKFHAHSFVLFEKNIEVPNHSILRSFLFNDPKVITASIKYCMTNYLPIFKGKSYESFLKNLDDNMPENMEESFTKAKRKVYGHGDLWKENIMFKYDNQNPIAACLVDFQITRLMNPAQDVLFLLMSSLEPSVRRQHFNQFLLHYHRTLNEILLNNEVDATNLYAEEDFREDIKLAFPICFTLTFFSIVLWLGFEDLNSLVLQKEKLLLVDEKEVMIMQLKEVIDDYISDFTELGFISE